MLQSWWVKTLRWSLVPVSVGTILASAFFLGRAVVDWFDTKCAPQNLIGGACVESWHTNAVETGIYAALVFGAFCLTTIPALIAPAWRRFVTTLLLLLVVVGAVGIHFRFGWSDFVLPLCVAVLVAALGCWTIWRKTRVVQ